MSQTYDAVVVGAGVTGASTAMHLQQANPSGRVLLLDKYNAPCMGNSQKSAAKVRDTVTSEVNRALCCTSIAAYRAYQEEANIGLSLHGYLWLMDDATRERHDETMQRMTAQGIDTDLLDSTALAQNMPQLNQALDPDAVEEFGLMNTTWGLFGRNCGSIDTTLLTEHYVKKFEAAGGTTMYNAEVVDFLLDRVGEESFHHLHIEGPIYGILVNHDRTKEPIYAGTTVLATGAWSPRLIDNLGIVGPHDVKPKKRQLYELETTVFDSVRGFNQHESANVPVPFTILPWKGLYIYQQEPGSLTIGCADTTGRASRFEEDPQGELGFFRDGVMPIAGSYFPDLADESKRSEIGVSAGQYNYSRDGVPFIGEIEKGLVVSNGSSGRGVMISEAVGRITAAAVRGETEVELFGGDHFDVDRLHPDPSRRNVDKEEWSI